MDYYDYTKALRSLRKISGPAYSDPYRAALTEIGHSRARLSAVGVTPPEAPTHPTLLTRAFDIIDRPLQAVASAVKAVLTPEKESILGEAWKGFTGRTKTTGEDILRAAGLLPENKYARWLASTGVEVLLDPTTWLTFGVGGLAKKAATEGVEALARRIIPEVAKETGKTISRQSALRLAENALKVVDRENALKETARLVGRKAFATPGEAISVLRTKIASKEVPETAKTLIPRLETQAALPVGRLETAIRRALGYEAETGKVVSRLPAVERAAAKQEAATLLGKRIERASRMATSLEKAVQKKKIPQEVAEPLIERLRGVPEKEITVTKTSISAIPRELPRYTMDIGTFMGFTRPIARVDITGTVNMLRGIAAKAGGKPAERAFDWLGRIFIRDYVPKQYQGVARTLFEEGKQIIARGGREAPSAAEHVLPQVLRRWEQAGFSPEIRRQATYYIEEARAPVTRALRKAEGKVAQIQEELGELIRSGATKRQIAAKSRSLASWEKKVEKYQEDIRKWRQVGFGAEEYAPETVKAARLAQEIFRDSADKLIEQGIPLRVIDNYVYHLYNDPPEKIRAALDRYRAGMARRVAGARPGFTLERSIPDLVTAKELGLHPVEDVALTTAVHQALTEQAVALQKMGRDLLRLGPDLVRPVADKPAGWVDLTSTGIPILRGIAVHPELEQPLKRLYAVMLNPDEGMRALDNLYSKSMRLLKASMTSWNPRFHVVNLVGNIFLNLIDGITDPGLYEDAWRILTGKLEKVALPGREVPASTVLDWFYREGLPGQGMYRQVAAPQTVLGRATTEAARLGLTPSAQNILQRALEKPGRVGEATDSFARMINFLHHLKQGLSPSEAAARTRAVLYDYGALSETERKLFQHALMPFYAWLRFNMPAMLKVLATRPGIYMASQHLVESGKLAHGMKEENIPTWVRDMMAIPIGVDKQGRYIFFNPSLPIADLARIHSPSDWAAGLQEFANMLNPIATGLYALATNQNPFTGAPVSRYPDLPIQRFKDALVFALMQAGPTREALAAYRYVTEDPTKPLATKRIPGLGSLVVRVSPEAVQRQRTFELRDVLRQAIRSLEAKGVPVPEYRQLKPKKSETIGIYPVQLSPEALRVVAMLRQLAS